MRNPGIASSLSSVPPVWPSARPAIIGTVRPHAAQSGASASEILSPTPPVECLSTAGARSAVQRSRSPESIIATVQVVSSRVVMPRQTIAISSADSW